MALACAGAALPLDAATTARTAVGRAAEGASARSICTTLRWRLIVACVGGGLARRWSDNTLLAETNSTKRLLAKNKLHVDRIGTGCRTLLIEQLVIEN
jgi:hypothetical protein